MNNTHDVTALLRRVSDGEGEEAWGELFECVYRDLRAVSHRQRSRVLGHQTLGTTALINEAYLRLVDQSQADFVSRAHFLGAAAVTMRRILINYARDAKAEKRGGAAPHLELETAEARGLFSESNTLLDLEDALEKLEAEDGRMAKIVVCRVFGGMSIDETASHLNVSAATVNRSWRFALTWLRRAMESPES
ncbi:sigma-70 family RNA polymerase sigma factor [Parahaliea maris]|uniref:Sigma-70 family RNA polymerase sigma factor n=1 Tax=Parahaliea maris TaxID=2716870 RepID=A0A5C8ZX29_9GAMM|nr:ECF-type sigma factor [Parahaliea maris]TXS93008.1 sigma-70 family RNA polymerase sigma factor [Parahaliea maris]